MLAEEGEGGWRLLAPRPLDALRLDETVHPLRPLKVPEGAETNLPPGLVPVGLPHPGLKAKPAPLPPFWYWESLCQWLAEDAPKGFCPEGQEGPALEVRTHVSLVPETGTAEEGALFQTQGLRFAQRAPVGFRRVALSLWPDDPVELEGIHPLGGERRLAYWWAGGPGIPPLPEEVVKGVLRHRAARVVLLTPGLFGGAFLPQGGSIGGGQVVAALVGRAVPVSGWDLKRGRPKPSRRAVPAGSVYFVRLPEGWGEEEVCDWLGSVWFKNISDGEQDRRDGFGLAVVGVWKGDFLVWG